MNNLTKIHCVPCEGGVDPMTPIEIQENLKLLKLKWEVIDGKKIQHQFEFKNFKEAMEFVNKVAEIAEEEQHHPDIYIFYNKVRIELWTHAINGLFKNDFILAAKIELL
ncbi:4a-hydroxytetrahydrobiopterin dehydratase [soil metagenome]